MTAHDIALYCSGVFVGMVAMTLILGVISAQIVDDEQLKK